MSYETALQTAQAHLKNIEKMANTQRAQMKAKIEQPAGEVPPVVVIEQASVKKAEPKVKKQQSKLVRQR